MRRAREECPIDLIPFVLDRGLPIITWMRVAAFQCVSLRLIAEGVLVACPRNHLATASSVDTAAKELYFREEEKCSDLSFPGAPISLVVSTHNQGAAELAAELTTTFGEGIQISVADSADKLVAMFSTEQVAMLSSNNRAFGSLQISRAYGFFTFEVDCMWP